MAKVTSSKVVYKGRMFYITADEAREPGGVKVQREVVHHPGSVVILAVDDSGKEPKVLLARQYRYAAGRFLRELPAGKIDRGESPLAAARRELAEETGFTAKHWKRVLFYWPTPGVLDETMTFYLATGLTSGTPAPEEDEKITVRFHPISEAVRMAAGGTLYDGKTIAGVFWLWHHRQGKRRV